METLFSSSGQKIRNFFIPLGEKFFFLVIFTCFFMAEHFFHPSYILGLYHSVIFYFVLYYPYLISLWGFLFLSVLLDGLVGKDLGLTFLQFILIFGCLSLQKQVSLKNNFGMLWIRFILYMVGLALLLEGLEFFLEGFPKNLSFPYLSLLWVSLSYPFVTWLFSFFPFLRHS